MSTKLRILETVVTGLFVSAVFLAISEKTQLEKYFRQTRLVDGDWSGYFIENSLKIVSVMRLKSSGSILEGTMVDNRTKTTGNLFSVKYYLNGRQDDENVTILKRIDEKKHSPEVVFSGILSEDGHALTGTWKSEHGYGSFRFIREN